MTNTKVFTPKLIILRGKTYCISAIIKFMWTASLNVEIYRFITFIENIIIQSRPN